MSRFAAVDEVVEFLKGNDVDLNWGMFVVADATGRSVVIEWANGQVQVIQSGLGYQICTNDLLSPTGEPFRHSASAGKLVDGMLRDQTVPSVGLIRRVLSATCAQFDFTTTLYSTICDLANQQVLLYHFHNFEEVVVLDLKKELAKGASVRSIPDLFPVHPYSFDGYPGVGRQLDPTLVPDDIDIVLGVQSLVDSLVRLLPEVIIHYLQRPTLALEQVVDPFRPGRGMFCS